MIIANQRGQMTIEMILIMTILLGIGLAVSNYAKEKGWMSALVEGPWKPMQGMIEEGVWAPTAKAKSMSPHLVKRRATVTGDTL